MRDGTRELGNVHPLVAPRDRHDDVEAAAARRLQKWREVERFEQVAHVLRGVAQYRPRDACGGEAEHDPVGALEARKARAPCPEFVVTVLHGAHDARGIRDANERRRASTRAGRRGDRPRRELRHEPRSHPLVVVDDVEFRVSRRFGDDAFRVTDADTGDAHGGRRGGVHGGAERHAVPSTPGRSGVSKNGERKRRTRPGREDIQALGRVREVSAASFTGIAREQIAAMSKSGLLVSPAPATITHWRQLHEE